MLSTTATAAGINRSCEFQPFAEAVQECLGSEELVLHGVCLSHVTEIGPFPSIRRIAFSGSYIPHNGEEALVVR